MPAPTRPNAGFSLIDLLTGIAIGALVQVAPPINSSMERPTGWIVGLAVVSIALVAINMFGGFAVTQRMLQMFRK